MILLPLVTGVGGPASEGFPEVERLLTLQHRFLVIPWEDGGHCPSHLALVPMTALASRSWVRLCISSPPVPCPIHWVLWGAGPEQWEAPLGMGSPFQSPNCHPMTLSGFRIWMKAV